MPKAPCTIGELRQRIVIQTLSTAPDDQGGSTETWTTFATVWAKIEPVSSRERYYSEQIQYQRSHKITMRYLAGVTNTMRISFDSRTFQIKGTRRLDERRFWMAVDVEENQGT